MSRVFRPLVAICLLMATLPVGTGSAAPSALQLVPRAPNIAAPLARQPLPGGIVVSPSAPALPGGSVASPSAPALPSGSVASPSAPALPSGSVASPSAPALPGSSTALPSAPAQRGGSEAPVPQLPLSERYRQVEPPPRLGSHATVLLDWQTGEVIWARNGDRRLHPASTTKVLTGLIAIERGNLEERVRISKRAARTPGSTMYLKEGEVHSLHDLVYGLLLRSGNDAAVALAEAIAGSVEEFAVLMNDRAQRLGAKNSHFVNPHGLTHNQHLSTAYDLAVITRAALANPTFAAIVSLPSKELTYEDLDRKVVLYNTNRLLGWVPGADGVKTGTTGAAGACLISSATRDEQKLIAVVLNAPNRWQESARLLEWGFSNFQLARLGRSGEVVRNLPVPNGKERSLAVAMKDDLALVLPRKGATLPEMEVELAARVRAPIKAGQTLGYAGVPLPDGQQRRVELVAAHSVKEASWLDRLHHFLVSLVRATDEMGMNISPRS